MATDSGDYQTTAFEGRMTRCFDCGTLYEAPYQEHACSKTADPSAFVTYRSDPEEDAWYASADGLRLQARGLREEAARMVGRAAEMERQADAL